MTFANPGDAEMRALLEGARSVAVVEQVGPIVDNCIALGLRARKAGMLVVMDRCIAVERRRLLPTA